MPGGTCAAGGRLHAPGQGRAAPCTPRPRSPRRSPPQPCVDSLPPLASAPLSGSPTGEAAGEASGLARPVGACPVRVRPSVRGPRRVPTPAPPTPPGQRVPPSAAPAGRRSCRGRHWGPCNRGRRRVCGARASKPRPRPGACPSPAARRPHPCPEDATAVGPRDRGQRAGTCGADSAPVPGVTATETSCPRALRSSGPPRGEKAAPPRLG